MSIPSLVPVDSEGALWMTQGAPGRPMWALSDARPVAVHVGDCAADGVSGPTPSELDTAARALAGIGRVIDRGSRTPLGGADAGRWRTYARIRITGVSPSARPAAAPANTPATLPDLAA